MIEFLGDVSTDRLWQEFARCRALLFAADEDFGMVPLEVQACGRPVIAYGVGGSLETVRGGEGEASPTGTYFFEQTGEAAAEAIVRWEQSGEPVFRAEQAREWAARFATPVFLQQYRDFVLQHAPGAEEQAASVAEASAMLAPVAQTSAQQGVA